ncbi:BatD family protein [Enterovibrio norvegicus]|uniref:BatD family protein n=1 Tax=Enterovibrio norvegicus TaxID=188144 RepID=UPI000C838DD0|nr:BatD family protein [Enterovibrio norvegicus]PML76570.1 hypothetical protein BCT69_22990 [Enterovibrio norvegicus]
MALLPLSASAADAVATVSKNVVAINEPFQLTLSVNDSVDTDDLDLIALAEHFTYGRPSVSNSTSFINGDMTRKTEIRIAVAAKELGTFTIPSFQLEDYVTAPIRINVVEASQRAQQANDQSIQVNVRLDRQSGYIGETFSYNVELLIGTRVDSPALQAPFGDGLTVEQVGEDQQAETVRNGRRYIAIQRQYQITPNQAGELTLNGAVFTGTKVDGNRWNSTLGLPISRQANAETLSIQGQPAGYTGLWLPTPSLTLSQRWEPEASEGAGSAEQAAKVGDPITRFIALRIENIAQSAMPNLSVTYPSRVRVYSEKPEYRQDGDATIMTMKQVIIPREAGIVSLPSVSINWFNTTTGKQETSAISGLTLNVVPSDEVQSSQPILPNAEQTLLTPAPVTTKVVTQAGYWPWATGAFALLWLVTLALYLRKPKQVAIAANVAVSSLNSSSSALSALEAAVAENDAVKVAAAYRQWQQEPHFSAVPQTLRDSIDAEISTMMASRYSAESTAWENRTLLGLLKQARAVKVNAKEASSLKGLVP